MAILKDWAVVSRSPHGRSHLTGTVFGHHRKSDGTKVITGPIVEVLGKTVFTESGTEYELKEPSDNYMEFLKDNDLKFDPNNPIKLVDELSHVKAPQKVVW